MPEMTDRKTAEEGCLPTRQRNALCHLLDRPTFTPEEVARLDYRTLERASGVGKQSVEIIRSWLRHHGLDLSGRPTMPARPRVEQRKRKLERAIKFLREQGYEVHHTD